MMTCEEQKVRMRKRGAQSRTKADAMAAGMMRKVHVTPVGWRMSIGRPLLRAREMATLTCARDER
jgi:hypothetical protein